MWSCPTIGTRHRELPLTRKSQAEMTVASFYRYCHSPFRRQPALSRTQRQGRHRHQTDSGNVLERRLVGVTRSESAEGNSVNLSFSDPGGIVAISRWLSAAKPPDWGPIA